MVVCQNPSESIDPQIRISSVFRIRFMKRFFLFFFFSLFLVIDIPSTSGIKRASLCFSYFLGINSIIIIIYYNGYEYVTRNARPLPFTGLSDNEANLFLFQIICCRLKKKYEFSPNSTCKVDEMTGRKG